MSEGALRGVQVLDLSVDYAGALVAMTLADHGAEVIRISSEGALER
ncbi:MAG: CoA transferase, partial [Myxococcota bacterium]|nr:CoA transferase [Myxococcota bacterium]